MDDPMVALREVCEKHLIDEWGVAANPGWPLTPRTHIPIGIGPRLEHASAPVLDG